MKCHHRLKRITSMATTITCLLCSIPQQGFCAFELEDRLAVLGQFFAEYEEKEDYNGPAAMIGFFPNLFINSKPSCEKSFKQLGKLLKKSPDSLSSARHFCQSFLNQINARNGASLTLADASHVVSQNVDSLPIPVEYRADVLKAAKAIAIGNSFVPETHYVRSSSFLLGNYLSAKIDPVKIFLFVLLCVTIATVAYFAPAALAALVPAIEAAYKLTVS